MPKNGSAETSYSHHKNKEKNSSRITLMMIIKALLKTPENIFVSVVVSVQPINRMLYQNKFKINIIKNLSIGRRVAFFTKVTKFYLRIFFGLFSPFRFEFPEWKTK